MDYAKRVEELLKMPQSLCKICGLCCKVASFKAGMSYEEILELSNDKTNPSQADGARDFLTIFEPITREEAAKIAPCFVENVISRFPDKKNTVSFFKCRFINKDGNKCLIHEDRPQLCRMYPFPHERTIYHDQCGFKQQGQKNWQEIQCIIDELSEKQKIISQEKAALESQNELKDS